MHMEVETLGKAFRHLAVYIVHCASIKLMELKRLNISMCLSPLLETKGTGKVVSNDSNPTVIPFPPKDAFD
jgi:hypothetical protein